MDRFIFCLLIICTSFFRLSSFDKHAREACLDSIGASCSRLYMLVKRQDMIVAGVLAQKPGVLAYCPALRCVPESLNDFEKCVVTNVSQMAQVVQPDPTLSVRALQASIAPGFIKIKKDCLARAQDGRL